MSKTIENTKKELIKLIRESSKKRIAFLSSLSLDELNSLNPNKIIRQAD